MTKQIRAYGEGLILEWLLDEFEEGHPNVERVYSEPLIEELIENDGVRNVDPREFVKLSSWSYGSHPPIYKPSGGSFTGYSHITTDPCGLSPFLRG